MSFQFMMIAAADGMVDGAIASDPLLALSQDSERLLLKEVGVSQFDMSLPNGYDARILVPTIEQYSRLELWPLSRVAGATIKWQAWTFDKIVRPAAIGIEPRAAAGVGGQTMYYPEVAAQDYDEVSPTGPKGNALLGVAYPLTLDASLSVNEFTSVAVAAPSPNLHLHKLKFHHNVPKVFSNGESGGQSYFPCQRRVFNVSNIYGALAYVSDVGNGGDNLVVILGKFS